MELKELQIVIIAKNEEDLLPDCFESIGNFAQVLLIDTGSTDKTVDVAKKHSAKVVSYKEGKHFSDWRNKGMKEADRDWVLYLDADERMTGELKQEIQSQIKSEQFNAYAIPRKNIILGKELIHGGWYPDYQKRLYKKSSFKKWSGDLHEEPDFEGNLGLFKNPMIHNKHENFAQMIEKTNRWSNIEGELMFKANHPPMNKKRFVSGMAREFWKRMIVHKAFLDGRVGVMFAMYQVFSRFASYTKLWEMQLENHKK
jgi:glycosyltransferase involved in cell wall biosynthesis